MTKLAKNKLKKGGSLDTLVLLSTRDGKKPNNGRKAFIKKQIAKSITLAQLFPLIDLDSPLKKSYWRTWHCNNILLQDGHKMTSSYCNGRWCNVCNRVRMAKMINGYSAPLLKLKDLHFVTLTAPNVFGEDLTNEIDCFFNSWRKIYKNIKKNYKHLPLRGMRKFEITFKPHTGYNPHFHFIIEGKKPAELIVKLWLDIKNGTKINAQDIRKANDGSLLELFKYAAKGVHKGKFHAKEIDWMYQNLHGRKTYYPVGIKKVTTEDVDEIDSQEITFAGNRIDVWKWDKDFKDWVCGDEVLTGYILDGKLDDWINKLTDENESG